MSTVVVEYIWLGGNNEFRSKTRVLHGVKSHTEPSSYPEWSYDGSSTKQATGDDSEVILKPCAVFQDPFLNSNGVLLLCDTYDPNEKELPNNHRKYANDIFNRALNEKPWFGIEQEFYLTSQNSKYSSEISVTPLGMNNAIQQGQYYCSVGSNNAFGRNIVNEAFIMCLNAGIKVSGMNAEVAPGQWEIQVGPCEGIESGDHLMMCRYILHRVAEKYEVQVNLDPKLVKGDWNGSGCHINYSTESMRNEGGYDKIISAIEKLGKRHDEHMEWYGEGNEQRMTGEHETARYDAFSYGVANRGASIRIPRQTHKEQKGYFEDRRPASNIDPYVVTAKIFETTVLDMDV